MIVREIRYGKLVGWSIRITIFGYFLIGHLYPFAFGPLKQDGFSLHYPSWSLNYGKAGTGGRHINSN